jgi:hypothetical protein
VSDPEVQTEEGDEFLLPIKEPASPGNAVTAPGESPDLWLEPDLDANGRPI